MKKALRENDITTLTPVEACLYRPGMYVGSIIEELTSSYVYENNKLIFKPLLQIPALLKIYSEIIDNATDESIRTDFKYATKIKINYNDKDGSITIEDNGRGLPIEQDKETGRWLPEIIFTSLHTGSNFNDSSEDKKQTIGMNGVGASLTAIYSSKFIIESANGKNYYKQIIENNTHIKRTPIIKKSDDNYTKITYYPNYNYFNISDEGKKNLFDLYYKRIKDLSFCFPEIQFTFNSERISGLKLKQFVETIHPIYECNEILNTRIAIFYSDTEFQQMSFVNGTYTSRGGTHVNYTTSKIVDYIKDFLKKKYKLEVKTIDIKSKLFLLLSLRMDLPQFDTQSKDCLISPNNFKALIDSVLTEKFLKSIVKNEEIIAPIVESYKLQQQVKENLLLKGMTKTKKNVRIDKYYPAVNDKKYLFLTEGDSANGLLMPALGRDNYSFFPLKGKPLNTLEAKTAKISDNDEIKKIVQILNLKLDSDMQNELTHDNICIATDMDSDGAHIKALLLCLFYRFAPSLLKAGKIKFLRTPLVTAKKNNKIVNYFYTLPEYKAFELKNPGHTYKYYKGLGSWKLEDLKAIFKEKGIDTFIKTFEWESSTEDMIKNWMGSAGINYRKEHVAKTHFDIEKI
jgi:DNA topoisomerase-2